jgi:nicotinate-nucleotide adenylyltransferase
MMKKLALFGGSFNPIHWGHLFLADYCREILNIDKVLFIPSAVSPLKLKHPDNLAVSSEMRRKLVVAAISGNPGFELETCELEREGPSYTIDTIQYLSKHNPKDELYLLIGEDNARVFRQWKDYEKILELTKVVVMKRRTAERSEIINGMILLPTPLIDISATEIRERIREGKSVRYYLPEAVYQLVLENGLYR